MNAGEGPAPPFRVLVAEDFADCRARLRALLGPLPLELVEAPDGQAAIDVVQDLASPLHLLITDLDMPRRTGWEVIDAVRRHRGPGLPVTLQTGEARYADVRKRAEELGVVLIEKLDVPTRLPAAVCGALGIALP